MVRSTSSTRQLLRYRTTVWGTSVDLAVTEPGALVGAVGILHEQINEIDRIANRFRPDSEISYLSQSAGQWVGVSPGMLGAIRVALDAATVTEGAVDPTVGSAMCRLGYDRDFSSIASGVSGTLPRPTPVPGWRRINLDVERRAVRIPAGTLLDFGATAKAMAADRVAHAAATALGCGVLVSLGGDVAVAGPPPPEGFPIGLGDTCWQPDPTEVVAIFEGGLATSGIALRQWRLGTATVHHIIDPATSLPAPTFWRSVSVAAATCVDANVAATAAMVKGCAAEEWLEALGLPARLVSTDFAVRSVAGWPAADDDRPDLVSAAR